MSRFLFRIGHFAGSHPWRVLAAWAVIATSVVLLNGAFGGESTEEFSIPGAESQRAADALEARFPQETLYTSTIVFHSPEGLRDRGAEAAISQAVSRVAAADHVVGVNDPFDPDETTVSRDGTTALATVGYDTQEVGLEELEVVEAAMRGVREAGVQVEYGGALGYANPAAEPSSELVAIVAAVVVLLLAFGSVVATGLPLVAALTAIVMGSSLIGILSGLIAVPKVATVVGLMLGLGVGIDYALFVLSRHRQNLDQGMSVPQATGQANATAGLSVLFAGVTVVVAIAGMQISGIPMLAVMGWASALMVAVTMLAALTLLPALLGVAGRRIDSLRVPFLRQHPGYDPRSAAARWAAFVVRKPVGIGIAALLVLGALAAPVASMRLGFADAGNDGPSTTTRKAHDLTVDAYGAGVDGPLQVVVESSGGALSEPQLSSLADSLASVPGVATVGTPVINDDATLALLNVTPTSGPQEEATAQLLERLRSEVPSRRRPAGPRRGDGHRNHSYPGRPLRPARAPHGLVPGRRDRALVPAPDAGLPVAADPAQGGPAQPAQRWCLLRSGGGRLPVGLGRQPDRRPRNRADHAARADVDVRDPLRSLDGLRGVPPQPDP